MQLCRKSKAKTKQSQRKQKQRDRQADTTEGSGYAAARCETAARCVAEFKQRLTRTWEERCFAVVKEAEVRGSALALLGGKKRGTSRTRSRSVLMPWPYLKMCNSQCQYLIHGADRHSTTDGAAAFAARCSEHLSKCEAAKQAFLATHRWLPAARPRSESLPSSRSRSSACFGCCQKSWPQLLSGGRDTGISFRPAHAVSREGERSRDWLAAPQPSPAASLFVNQGEQFGACPRQPLRLHLTRKANPVDACSS